MKKGKIVFLCIGIIIGASIVFFIKENINLKKELKRLVSENVELDKEKDKILETAFYMRNYLASDYYLRDNYKYEKFMMDGTRIILEEMEKYKKIVPLKGKMDKQEIKNYLKMIYVGCELVGIDPYLSLFQSVVESAGFNKFAVSSAGALGTEQFMPLTAKFVANSYCSWKELQTPSYSEKLLYNPIESKKLNIRYMKELLEEYEGCINWALLAYNVGPTRVSKEWWNKGESVFFEDVPLEFQEYVEVVMENYIRIVYDN